MRGSVWLVSYKMGLKMCNGRGNVFCCFYILLGNKYLNGAKIIFDKLIILIKYYIFRGSERYK